jgi:hypothetical protein
MGAIIGGDGSKASRQKEKVGGVARKQLLTVRLNYENYGKR